MSSVAGDTEPFSLYEDELWGSRPDRLYEVRPQERVQRRTVQQIVDIAPLPTLDDPAPLMGETAGEGLQVSWTSWFPSRFFFVPKIFVDDIPPRRLCRKPQMVDQLVTVLTNPGHRAVSSRVLLRRLWRTSW